jgi:hypothetical protein
MLFDFPYVARKTAGETTYLVCGQSEARTSFCSLIDGFVRGE